MCQDVSIALVVYSRIGNLCGADGRQPWIALDSLAAILAVNMLGTAIAAIMAIIATTIKSSIREKPCSFFMESILLSVIFEACIA